MAIGGAVSVAAVRHMHSTVERETDQLKNADANGKTCLVHSLLGGGLDTGERAGQFYAIAVP
jgi:hypothetical protein